MEIIRQVATAVHKLHEAGIIHRDIKPANIMVSPDGKKAVLMDLGVARVSSAAVAEMTGFRHFVGTLPYSSPEQSFSADSADARNDVYSLGATLWELLTLRPLLGAQMGISERELIRRIQFAAPEPVRRYNRAVTYDLQAIVLKCLCKNPENRYPTAAELAADLTRCLAGQRARSRGTAASFLLERGEELIGVLAAFVVRRPVVTAGGLLVAIVALATYGFRRFEARDAAAPESTEQLIMAPLAMESMQTAPITEATLNAPQSATEPLQIELVESSLEALPAALASSFKRIPGSPNFSLQVVQAGKDVEVAIPFQITNTAISVRLRHARPFWLHIYNGAATDGGVAFGNGDDRPRDGPPIMHNLAARSITRIGGWHAGDDAVPTRLSFSPVQQPLPSTAPVASKKLDDAISGLADQIAAYIKTEESTGKSVIVEGFRGPNQTVNPSCAALMKQKLAARGLKCVAANAFTVESRILLGDDGSGETAVQIRCKVLGPSGDERHTMTATFVDTELAIETFAPMVLGNPNDGAFHILYDLWDVPLGVR